MKSISVEIKRPIVDSISSGFGVGARTTEGLGPSFKLNSRLLVRTKDGVFITTLVKAQPNCLVCKADSGRQLVFNATSRAILGEGIQRRRKTAIPDDELFMWRKEVRASELKAKNKGNKEC